MRLAIATCALLVSACTGERDGSDVTTPTDTFTYFDSCPAARPDFPPANAADRALFAYEASAPLSLQKKVDSIASDVEFNSITFDSPGGGSVPGLLNRPIGRAGLRPAVVVMHPSGNATGPLKGARLAQNEMAALAKRGAVVIGIDAPYFRRGGTNPPTLTAVDRPEQIQLMKDLQRAVDVLLAQGNVDPARIGFSGYSYGGMVGVHFAGIEKRLRAAVIMAAYGGSVSLATSKSRVAGLPTLSCETRAVWFADNVPIEAIRFIAGAAPTALLFQIARFDTAVPLEDAQAAYTAASSPKEVFYYDTGHGLSPQATADRFTWLAKQIGIDP
jgi:dienelactone hydrolase